MKQLLFIFFIATSTLLTLGGCAETDTSEGQVVHTKACTIEITGMMCEKGCKSTIQNRINEMDGIIDGEVDYPLGKAFVTYDANVLSCDDIIDEIESIGDGGLYEATIVEDKDIENAPEVIEGEDGTPSASVSAYTFEVPNITSFFSDLL